MSMVCPKCWVVDEEREKYSASGHYPHVEEDVLNIGIGCSTGKILGVSIRPWVNFLYFFQKKDSLISIFFQK